MLGKNFGRCQFEIFFLFFHNIGLDISCKFSPKKTICMKCQSLFLEKKNKINIINLSSSELAQNVKYIHSDLTLVM